MPDNLRVLPEPEPDECMVQRVEELLVMVKSGKVRSLAVVFEVSDGVVSKVLLSRRGSHRFSMLGGLSYLSWILSREIEAGD